MLDGRLDGLCVSDWHMVSDAPSVLPNAPQYFDHRLDQSILGLLIKALMINQSVVSPPAHTRITIWESLSHFDLNMERNPLVHLPRLILINSR
jgi:hypothetical protein